METKAVGKWIVKDDTWKKPKKTSIRRIKQPIGRYQAPQSTAHWNVPLKQLPNTYFEIKLKDKNKTTDAVFVGVCPEECKAVSQWSNTDGGCWIRRVASSRPSNKGDIIGCGINKNSQMFFVVDGEIEYEDFLPNEFCTVYPFVITNV